MSNSNIKVNCAERKQLILETNDDEEQWADAVDSLPVLNQEEILEASKTSVSNSNSKNGRRRSVGNLSNSSASNSSFKTDLSDLSIAYPLHYAVFNNDCKMIWEILRRKKTCKEHINKKDVHGNTPLHLACMLGRPPFVVGCLLGNGASVEARNLQRWSPFSEACSYGNREIIKLMTTKLKLDFHQAIHKKDFAESLQKIKNCRLVLKWEFQSWIPFVTKVLPSDVCVITKQGGYIRIDTKLLDFEMLSWRHGDSYLIYSDKFHNKWILVDNKTKKYQHLDAQKIVISVEDRVDELMSSDIIDIELKSTDIQLTRSTCGWIWKEDKIEKIGKYNSALYNFHNVFLSTRKRREHLTDEDLKRNKADYKGVIDVLKFGKGMNKASNDDDEDGQTDDENGNNIDDDEDNQAQRHRESLAPPPERNVSWKDYINSMPGEHPTLGREPKIKTVKNAFKANVAMSQEFPMTKSDLLELISIIPLKHFKKMQEFIELRLPDGFPVRLDIPIFPFLTARITFEDFAFVDEPIEEALFSIPSDYVEDKKLFWSLTGKFKGGQQTKQQSSE